MGKFSPGREALKMIPHVCTEPRGLFIAVPAIFNFKNFFVLVEVYHYKRVHDLQDGESLEPWKLWQLLRTFLLPIQRNVYSWA